MNENTSSSHSNSNSSQSPSPSLKSKPQTQSQSKPSDIYEVEKILGKKMINDKVMYHIKWKGYPISQSTWEPLSNLDDIKEMVAAYDEKGKSIEEKQKKTINSNSRNKESIEDNKSFLKKKRKRPKKKDFKDKDYKPTSEPKPMPNSKPEIKTRSKSPPKLGQSNEDELIDKDELGMNEEIELELVDDDELKRKVKSENIQIMSIVKVKKYQNTLYAIIKYKDNLDDNKIKYDMITTSSLAVVAPKLILDYYESKLKFKCGMGGGREGKKKG